MNLFVIKILKTEIFINKEDIINNMITMITCRKCGKEFENRSLLSIHKIKEHGYTRQTLGQNIGGWNKGIPYTSKGNRHSKITLKELNKNPEFLEKRQISRQKHEKKVQEKAKEYREKGFKVFETSNYSHHRRIPDLIVISPKGKIIAIELESLKIYKPSLETLRKRYTNELMTEGFFDEVIVIPFVSEENNKEKNNRGEVHVGTKN